MKSANIISRPSLTRTLLALPIGEERIIPCKQFDTQAVRKKATYLKSKGYDFSVSSPRGCVDTVVTRIR